MSATRSRKTCVKATRRPESCWDDMVAKRALATVIPPATRARARAESGEMTPSVKRQRNVVASTPRMASQRRRMIHAAWTRSSSAWVRERMPRRPAVGAGAEGRLRRMLHATRPASRNEVTVPRRMWSAWRRAGPASARRLRSRVSYPAKSTSQPARAMGIQPRGLGIGSRSGGVRSATSPPRRRGAGDPGGAEGQATRSHSGRQGPMSCRSADGRGGSRTPTSCPTGS